MPDADEPVGELAERGLVAGAAAVQLLVVGAGAGWAARGAERPLLQRVGEPPVAGVAGQDDFLALGGAGDG